MLTAKLIGPWDQKVYFLKLHMGVYFCTKFQSSSIFLTSFRQGRAGGIPPPTPKIEPLKAHPDWG